MHDESVATENRTYEEIVVGESASIVRRLTKADIELFALVSGDTNPTHLDERFAARGLLRHIVAHGMWTGGLFSAVLGTKLPGPGTVYVAQSLEFLRPVGVGDSITATVTVREKRPERRTLICDCLAVNQNAEAIARGVAEVKAPAEKIWQLPTELPEVQFRRHDLYHELLERSRKLAPVSTAVVHPCDAPSLTGALHAAQAGLIVPVFVGPEARIRSAAQTAGLDLSPYRIDPVPHSHAAAARAVALAQTGEIEALMKGSLHTDELMHEVMRADGGLRTARRISHVFVMDVPAYPKPLLITDAAINIAPTLEDKRDICQNAIDLAHVLGIVEPKLAVLSAVETVGSKLASTLDAAALCKMAERGQIVGARLDGPLAFDNAVSVEAARTKGIESVVAGRADILLVPDLEAGNMLAKQLTFLSGADAAGIVLGARVPIVLTSRADSVRTRQASCAVAVLVAEARRSEMASALAGRPT